jgi:plastocyanin
MKKTLIAALAATAVLSSCGGSADEPSTADAAEARTKAVTVQHIAFDPPTLEIAPGTEVTWTNRDAGVVHTATSGLPGDKGVPGLDNGTRAKPDGVFDGEMADDGASFSFTFEELGTYAYFCRVHQSMTGEVVVR